MAVRKPNQSTYNVITGESHFAGSTCLPVRREAIPRVTDTHTSSIFYDPGTLPHILDRPMRSPCKPSVIEHDIFLKTEVGPLMKYSKKMEAFHDPEGAGLKAGAQSPRGRLRPTPPGNKGEEIVRNLALKPVAGKHFMTDTNNVIPSGGPLVEPEVKKLPYNYAPPAIPEAHTQPDHKFVSGVKIHRPLVHPDISRPISDHHEHKLIYKCVEMKSSVPYGITEHTQDVVNFPASPRDDYAELPPWEKGFEKVANLFKKRQIFPKPAQELVPSSGRKHTVFTRFSKVGDGSITAHVEHTPQFSDVALAPSCVAHIEHVPSEAPVAPSPARERRSKENSFVADRSVNGVLMVPRSARSPGESQRRRPQRRHYDAPIPTKSPRPGALESISESYSSSVPPAPVVSRSESRLESRRESVTPTPAPESAHAPIATDSQ